MQFTSSPLLLAAVALWGAAGSIAQDPPRPMPSQGSVDGAYGCTDSYCWASCKKSLNPEEAPSVPDPSLPYEDGGNWCWLLQAGTEDDWIPCGNADECDTTVLEHYYTCKDEAESCDA